MKNEKSKTYNNFDTVVQSNSIIKATHNLTRNELLTFKKLISMVDTKNANRKIYFTKAELVEYLFPQIKGKGVDTCNEYYLRAKNYCKKLMDIILEFNTKERTTCIAFCSKLTWENYQNLVELFFTPDIMPYICEMKKNFTTYQIGMIQKIRSAYATRIYEYCKMHLHKRKWVWVENLNEFKKMLGAEKKYKNRFNQFNVAILKKSVTEINEKTDIAVSYKKLRNGKNIDRIEFTVKKSLNYIPK
ncbi:hypothetical protein AZF37_09665 (plasmid) [endosymbiont 'TC1' of Trimyema compressum]|uniref:replication initiation protein n=1 Tax=endosymbiont 'TC1' of Trimyema compressum TaxID=243899 RepID=UPI0007F0E1FC|nr:replication initiation protein [endosymbiont 'TC1' of Trimyema compressum]AMP21441.1 hypothetical protein AZF37_09665 [endosymbiont 'TC1' of Trimyema compressum]